MSELNEIPSNQQPAENADLKKQNVRALAIGFGIFLAVVLVVSLGIGVYRVFAKGASDGFSRAVATVLRLPAVKVNGRTILYKDYVNDLEAIKKVRSYDIKNNTQNANSAAALGDQDLSDQVLIRMVYNILVQDLAKELNVKVEDADVKEVKDALMAELKTQEAIDAELQDRYGWTFKEYENRVIRPLLLQSKVAEQVSTNLTAREEVQKKAQGILDQIKGGANFAELAKQYGEDGSAENGGSLGEFTSAALATETEQSMVPSFEDAVKKLKKGELAKELVETQYGFHIVKLDDARTVKAKDAAGKTVNKQYWTASHIIFMYPNINQKLNTKLKESNIKLYMNVHNPFTDLAKLP